MVVRERGVKSGEAGRVGMDAGWRRDGGGTESGWSRDGGGIETRWSRDRNEMESGERRDGVGRET